MFERSGLSARRCILNLATVLVLAGFALGDGSATQSDNSANNATQPATTRKVTRIIFIYAEKTQPVDAEIHKAVSQLNSDQWFNAYAVVGDGFTAFDPKLVEATDFEKKRFDKDFHPSGFSFTNPLRAIVTATKFNADVIWVVGVSTPCPKEDDFVKDLHKTTLGFHGRIDTAGDFVGHYADDLHFLWRLSHETGGVCVDKDGNPMDEPPMPQSPSPAPPPATAPQTPSILRD